MEGDHCNDRPRNYFPGLPWSHREQKALARLEAALGLFPRMTARTRFFVLIAKVQGTSI